MAENAVELTPAGRIPNTPLPNPRHELIAQATVAGKSCIESGLEAGYRPGPGLKGNVARLRQTPAIRERMAEIAARGTALAEVYAGWVLADTALFARSSLAKFFKRDADGNIIVDDEGSPIYDFTGADADDLRTLKKMRPTKYGTEYEVHDPLPYLDRLGRYLGLWSSDGAMAVANAEATAAQQNNLGDMSDHELSAALDFIRTALARGGSDRNGAGAPA